MSDNVSVQGVNILEGKNDWQKKRFIRTILFFILSGQKIKKEYSLLHHKISWTKTLFSFGALNNGHFFQHEIEMKIKAFASLIVGVFQNEFKITEKMRIIFVENRFVEWDFQIKIKLFYCNWFSLKSKSPIKN